MLCYHNLYSLWSDCVICFSFLFTLYLLSCGGIGGGGGFCSLFFFSSCSFLLTGLFKFVGGIFFLFLRSLWSFFEHTKGHGYQESQRNMLQMGQNF